MQSIATVFSQNNCQACESAIALLKANNYIVDIVKIDTVTSKEYLFKEFPTARAVPKIIIGENIKLENVAELKAYLSQ